MLRPTQASTYCSSLHRRYMAGLWWDKLRIIKVWLCNSDMWQITLYFSAAAIYRRERINEGH